MASGKTHDQSIIITGLAIAPLLYNYSNYDFAQIAQFTGLYIFSGLYLSPDIDMSKSVVSKRYGVLKSFWKPYQKLFPHRGCFINRNPLTHAPFLGTAIRLIYFLAVPGLFIILNNIVLNNDQKALLLMLFISCELASMIHLFLDWFYTTFKGH